MLSHGTKVALAGTWIMTAGLVGVLGNVTSLAAGAIVLGCGLVPPLLMLPLTAVPAIAVARRRLLRRVTVDGVERE